MSWGERSCSLEKAPKGQVSGCGIATPKTCNVDCDFYTWDGVSTPDSQPKGLKLPEKVQSARGLKKALKLGRNDPCPCGSGKKAKKCCHQAKDRPMPSHLVRTKKIYQSGIEIHERAQKELEKQQQETNSNE